MLVAIMLGRRALTLRAVALAAVIVLTLRPEALTGPGFQMSFAATTALIGVFGWLRDAEIWQTRFSGWMRGACGLVVSSAVAGLATAPFAAAHFNQIAHYGLLANLLTVPVMGTVVMPARFWRRCFIPWAGGDRARHHGNRDRLDPRSGRLGGRDRNRDIPCCDPGAAVLPADRAWRAFLVIWQSRIRWRGWRALPPVF